VSTTVSLRIVVLQIEPDVWCDLCGVTCGVTVTYVAEEGGRAPEAPQQLTYCESCDEI